MLLVMWSNEMERTTLDQPNILGLCLVLSFFQGGVTANTIHISSESAMFSTLVSTNPLWVQWIYISSFIVQSCDTVAFITLKGFPFFKRSTGNLTPFSIFVVRTYAATLFPFKLLCFLLRKHHIAHSEVGQAVGICFGLMHIATPLWYFYASRTIGRARFRVEPFPVIMAVHIGWVTWTFAAFLLA